MTRCHFNRVFLIGKVSRDPELRYLSNGAPTLRFGARVDVPYRRPDGSTGVDSLTVDVAYDGELAEPMARYMSAGTGVFVDGHLAVEDAGTFPDGRKRRRHIVVAEKCDALGHVARGAAVAAAV